jgi:hypothetical protein
MKRPATQPLWRLIWGRTLWLDQHPVWKCDDTQSQREGSELFCQLNPRPIPAFVEFPVFPVAALGCCRKSGGRGLFAVSLWQGLVPKDRAERARGAEQGSRMSHSCQRGAEGWPRVPRVRVTRQAILPSMVVSKEALSERARCKACALMSR